MNKRNPDGTRQKILDAAYREVYAKGFRAASLEQILSDTGLTKGALYHHFPNKNALGYAIVEEIIPGMIAEMWLRPIESATDPIDGLIGMLQGLQPEHIEMACTCGCPLANLAQEMSPIDEGFRVRIEAALDSWRDGITDALLRGQGANQVRTDIDSHKSAAFIVASIEGMAGMAKNSRDPSMVEACIEGLVLYLETLRVLAPVAAA